MPFPSVCFEQTGTAPDKSFPIDVYNEGSFKLPLTENPSFEEQATTELRRRGLIMEGNSKLDLRIADSTNSTIQGKRFAFYVDIPGKSITSIPNPYLYFFSMWGRYQIYAGKELISNGPGRTVYLPRGQVPPVSPDQSLRLTFVVENANQDQVSGLHYRHGLMILSVEDLSNLIQNEPFRDLFSRSSLGIFYFTLAILMAIFALSTRYLDVLLFPVVALLFGAAVWMETP